MFGREVSGSVIHRCGSSRACYRRSPVSTSQRNKIRDLGTPLLACFALLFASTVRAQTSGVNNGALYGAYVFNLNGFGVNAGASSPFAAVGRFNADGVGNLTAGLLDTNGISSAAVLSRQTFSGTYAIGAENRGVMTLNFQGGSMTLAFAMMANHNAKVIRFDATGGNGAVGSGTIEKISNGVFKAQKINRDYAFGVAGFDTVNNRTAMVGRLTANGAGAFTNGTADMYEYGTSSPVTITTANYTVTDVTMGRGTINLACSTGGMTRNFNFVFYYVSPAELLLMETDAITSSTALLNGQVLGQVTPPNGFSNASLNGDMVIYLTAHSICGSAPTASPIVLAGLLTANGSGVLNVTFDQNCGGTPYSVTNLSGTYSVASDGRASMMVGPYHVVSYLVRPKRAFILGTDSSGFGEVHPAGTYTNSSLTGTYAGSAIYPASAQVVIFSGEFTANGSSPTGDIAGTEDIVYPSGPSTASGFDATYAISASPTSGRGSITITSGSGGSAVVYVVSPSEFVAVPMNDPNPAVWLFQQ